MPTPLVRLYARADCHLCDEARAELVAMRADEGDFRVEEVDIDSDPGLARRYGERIPVVEVEGEIVSELGLDREGLRARLGTLSR